ncbi:MAG: hypothetical protein ACOX6T_23995 [Myxococcales bacterium]
MGPGCRTRHERAIAWLERALELLWKGQGARHDIARAQAALAAVRWEEGELRSRALELAKAARSGFQAAGPRYRAQLEQVEAWLAERGAP